MVELPSFKLTVLTVGLAGAAALLTGCAEIHHGVEAMGRVATTSPAAAEGSFVAPARAGGRTTEREAPVARAAALPSPREIFDFHSGGSASGGWRQPFVIDTADGPLANDVRRSEAELKAYNAGIRSGTKVAEPHPCRESDVAAQKPGCASGPRALSAAARGDAAPQ